MLTGTMTEQEQRRRAVAQQALRMVIVVACYLIVFAGLLYSVAAGATAP
jgi:hypothetical protein